MTRKVTAVVMIVAITLSAAPILAQAQTGTISGTALDQSGQTLANITVQLRDVATKQIVGTTTTNAQGAFAFVGLDQGQFVVEIVNAQGAIVSTTTPITLSAGAMVATGVTVTATAAGAIAGGAAAAEGLGTFFTTTAGIITVVAIAGGVTAAIIATQDDASPSR